MVCREVGMCGRPGSGTSSAGGVRSALAGLEFRSSGINPLLQRITSDLA